MNSSGNELLLTAGCALKQTTKVMALNHYSPFFNLVLSCALVWMPYMSKWFCLLWGRLSRELPCGILTHLLLGEILEPRISFLQFLCSNPYLLISYKWFTSSQFCVPPSSLSQDLTTWNSNPEKIGIILVFVLWLCQCWWCWGSFLYQRCLVTSGGSQLWIHAFIKTTVRAFHQVHIAEVTMPVVTPEVPVYLGCMVGVFHWLAAEKYFSRVEQMLNAWMCASVWWGFFER